MEKDDPKVMTYPLAERKIAGEDGAGKVLIQI